MDISLEGISLR